jgi:flagellar motor switch protein FliG
MSEAMAETALTPATDGGAAGIAQKRRIPGIRKAAILLVAIGDDLARKLLVQLPDADVQKVTEEIAELKGIAPELSADVVEEFHEMLTTQQYMVHGGIDYARKLLVEAFGKQRAEDLMSLVRRAQEASHGDLAMLEKVDPVQLGKFLESEHPQTVALVLAHLDPRRASSVLEHLDPERRVAAVRRLAALREFSPEMAQKIAVILHRQAEHVGESSRKSYSGFKAVADLLNRVPSDQSKVILEKIEEDDPEMALGVRNLMFTFEDLVTVPPASMREIVAEVDKKQLALALRGAREDLKAHVFRAMSSRAVEMLKEDMEVMGPVRAREVAAVQQEILQLARRLEAEGKVILKIEAGDDLVV